MKAKKLWYKITLLTSASITMAGCGSLLSPVKAPQINTYTISSASSLQINDASPQLKDLTIFVGHLLATAPYDTNQMIYSTEAMRLNNYSANNWSTNPSTLINQVLAYDLNQAQIFKNVTTSNFIGYSNYRLVSQLQKLLYNVNNDRAQTDLVITYALLESRHNNLIAQKTFSVSIPSDTVSPQDFAQSTNQAVQELSQQVSTWVVKTLETQIADDKEQFAKATSDETPSMVQETSNTTNQPTKNATPNN